MNVFEFEYMNNMFIFFNIEYDYLTFISLQIKTKNN